MDMISTIVLTALLTWAVEKLADEIWNFLLKQQKNKRNSDRRDRNEDC